MAFLAEVTSSILLFFLVYGMSATVEISHLLVQVRNIRALLIGCGMQFVILPFIGFLCIRAFQLPAPVGITLMVVTSSPGGSYSNWWCSVFNAELALSVTMTAISTILSTVMLPFNLLLYSKWTYSAAVVQHLDWDALFVSICVVIGGITAGLITSAYGKCTGRSIEYHRKANLLGNTAGISLIVLSIIVSIVANNNSKSSNEDDEIAKTEQSNGAMWNQDWTFYVGCALPVILGLNIATYFTRKAELEKPERVAAVIESCYQNTGIATSVALSMFSGSQKYSSSVTNIEVSNTTTTVFDFGNRTTNITSSNFNSNLESVNPVSFGHDNLAMAMGVPLYYGIVEAVSLATFCIICWKTGWTKAPADENICTVITTSYEVKECVHRLQSEQQEDTAIEVVWDPNSSSSSQQRNHDHDNANDGATQSDLIFSQSGNGQYVVDSNTLDQVQQRKESDDKQNCGRGSNRRRSDSSTEITMVDDEDYSGGESTGGSGHSDNKEEDPSNSRKYSPKRIWKKLVPSSFSSGAPAAVASATMSSSNDAEDPVIIAYTKSQAYAEDNNPENLSTTSQSDGPNSRSSADSQFSTQQANGNTSVVRLQRTISRVRARAAGYQQQLAITTSSSNEENHSAIAVTKHTRKIVRGGRILHVETNHGVDDFDEDNSSCSDDDYNDVENNEHGNDDYEVDTNHGHPGTFRRRRQRYETVETRSPSELINRQEADERNQMSGFTSVAETARID